MTADGMYTVWNNGKVVRMAVPGSGGSASPPQANLEFFLGSLASSPLHETRDGSLLVVGTKSGNLQAYDRRTGSFARTLPLGGLARKVSGVEDDLLVTLDGGTVLRVRLNPPAVIWRRHIGSSGDLEAHALGGVVACVTRRNDLVFLRASDGMTTLAQSFPLTSTLCVAPAEKRIFLLDKGGGLFLLGPEGGNVLKARGLKVKHRSLAAIPKGLAVVLDDGRSCLLVDPDTLEPLWVARVGADIRTIAAREDLIVIAAEDGTLTAFRR